MKKTEKHYPAIKWPFLLLIFCFHLILNVYYTDTQKTWNTTSRALTVNSLVTNNGFQIDKHHALTGDKAYFKGHYYSEKAPLPSVITAGVCKILQQLNWIHLNPETLNLRPIFFVGSWLCSCLPFALLMTLLLYQLIKSNTLALWKNIVLSCLPFYGSFLFNYSGAFFSHLLAGFFIVLAILSTKRHQLLLSGFLLSCAFLCDYITIVCCLIIPLWAIFKYRSIKPAIIISLGAIPLFLGFLYYNYNLFGGIFESAYNHLGNPYFSTQSEHLLGFGFPDISRLYYLIFSDYRGLFFYVPVFIILSVYAFIQRKNLHAPSLPFLCFLVIFLMGSSYFSWTGGWCYGPRTIIAGILPLLYFGVIWLAKVKAFWPVLISAIVGFMIHIPAKLTLFYSVTDAIIHPHIKVIFPAFYKGWFSYQSLLTHYHLLNKSEAAYLWMALFLVGLSISILLATILKNRILTFAKKQPTC